MHFCVCLGPICALLHVVLSDLINHNNMQPNDTIIGRRDKRNKEHFTVVAYKKFWLVFPYSFIVIEYQDKTNIKFEYISVSYQYFRYKYW